MANEAARAEDTSIAGKTKVTNEDVREMNQDKYEEAAVAIRQARRFQFLIHKQENTVKKEQIEKK